MFTFLWKLLKRAIFVLLVLLIAFGTFIGVLGVRTSQPRASDTWQRLPNLPRPRGEAAAAIGVRLDDVAPGRGADAVSPQLFVIGGLAGLGRTSDAVDVFTLDAPTDSWSEGPALPEPRHHMAAAGVDGTVYVTGGSITATDWTPEDNVWRLEPQSDTWEDIGPMPEARMGHQMVAIQDRLFVIGGRGETADVLVYDTTQDEWSIGAPMPQQRDHLGVAVVGLRLYALGGRDETLTDRVDVYDILADTWLEGPALPEPMSAMAVATLSDGIHVVGGEEPATLNGYVIDKHYVLRPGGTEWREGPLPILPTHGSAAATTSGSLIIAGGARRQGALSPIGWTGLVQVYTPGLITGNPTPSPTPTDG